MNKTNKTHWHRLLGVLLEKLLTPIGITVQCDVKVMVNPPEADILLLRCDHPQWTKQQQTHLPDGIRDSKAQHHLLEFKYTESVNADALMQTLGYDFFYKRSHKLTATQVQSYLLSAKTPQAHTLQQFGYELGAHKGVYHSQHALLNRVTLIVLNELTAQPHNAAVKFFCSRRKEKQKAFQVFKTEKQGNLSFSLNWFLNGLWNIWFSNTDEGAEQMHTGEITPEMLIAMGKKMEQSLLALIPVEKRLEGLSIKKRLEGLSIKKRLEGLSTKQRLDGLNPQDIFERFKPSERLAGLNARQRLEGLDIKQRLDGLDAKQRLDGLDAKQRLDGLDAKQRLDGLDAKQRLDGLDAKQRLDGLDAKQRLDGLDAKQRLDGLDAKQRLDGLDAKQRLDGLDAKQRLDGLDVKQRLDGLSIAEIQAYLKQLK